MSSTKESSISSHNSSHKRELSLLGWWHQVLASTQWSVVFGVRVGEETAGKAEVRDTAGNVVTPAVDVDEDKLERWEIKAEKAAGALKDCHVLRCQGSHQGPWRWPYFHLGNPQDVIHSAAHCTMLQHLPCPRSLSHWRGSSVVVRPKGPLSHRGGNKTVLNKVNDVLLTCRGGNETKGLFLSSCRRNEPD